VDLHLEGYLPSSGVADTRNMVLSWDGYWYYSWMADSANNLGDLHFRLYQWSLPLGEEVD